MVTSDIYTARNELFACLDTPIYELWPHAECKQRDWANEAAVLAARFIAALEEAGGDKELDRRFTKMGNITGMGSPYQFARGDAFQRLQLLKEASPDDRVERVAISKLVTPILPENAPKDFLVWQEAERLVGEAGSILWRPYELSSYCMRFAEFNKYPELPEFWHELERVLTEVRTELLWGSYLLAVSSDVHRSAQPDCYFLLEGTILRSKGAVAAIKEATDDLFVGWHVDGKQLEKYRYILLAMLDMGAFDSGTRQASDDIFEKALGGERRLISDLRKMGLIHTGKGRGGKCWLTPVGRSIAAKLGEVGASDPDGAMAADPAPGARPRAEDAKSGALAMQDGLRQRQPNARSAKSSREKEIDRQSWDAGMWVRECRKEHPAATPREIIAHVLHLGCKLPIPDLDDAIKSGRTDGNSKR